MKPNLKLLGIAAICFLFASCQSSYWTTITPPRNRSPKLVETEVQNTLNGFLLARGFERVDDSGWWLEMHRDESIGLWRRKGKLSGLESFWWGDGYVDVEELRSNGGIAIWVTQVNGKPGQMQATAEEVFGELKNRFPGYSVKLRKHTMYLPSWSKN